MWRFNGRAKRSIGRMLFHPNVVHFPIALWLTSTFFDLLGLRREKAIFREMAFWLVGLGLVELVGVSRRPVGLPRIGHRNRRIPTFITSPRAARVAMTADPP